MNGAPEFHPYGLPHLSVIFLTIALPFVLASLVRRTKSQRIEKLIIGGLSAVVIFKYLAHLIFFPGHGVFGLGQKFPVQKLGRGVVVGVVGMWAGKGGWFEGAY